MMKQRPSFGLRASIFRNQLGITPEASGSSDRDWAHDDVAVLEISDAQACSVAATLLLLAQPPALRYGCVMSLVALRRLAHLMLALTLAVGLATQGVRAADMSAKANNRAHALAAHMGMAAASGMPTCNKCDACKNGSCKGNGCMLSGTCSTYCGNLAALPVVGGIVEMPLSESVAHAVLPSGIGWAAPPDPYPPRTAILS